MMSTCALDPSFLYKVLTEGQECQNRSNLSFASNFVLKYILSTSLFYLKIYSSMKILKISTAELKKKFWFEKKIFARSFFFLRKWDISEVVEPLSKEIGFALLFLQQNDQLQEIFTQLLQKKLNTHHSIN